MHDRRRGRQPSPVAHTEVERRPDDDDDVRVLERIRARQLEVMRISRRQGPAPRAVHEGRHVQHPTERARGAGPPAGPDLAAEEDAGLLRPHENLGELFDGRRVADALRRRPVVAGLRDARFGTVDLGIEDVASNLQVRWAKSAVIALPEGHRDHVGDALGRVDARGELGDRLEDVDVGQVLQ